MASTSAATGRSRRHLAAALAAAGTVVAVRSVLIARAHSECFDARAHVDRGLAFLGAHLVERRLLLNDPPLGDGLLALPVAAINVLWGRAATAPWDSFYYLLPPGPEWSAVAVALWKSLLFLPFLAVVWAWCLRLHGLEAAWLALAALVVDPTIAAHVPVMALDVLGLEGVVIACFALWRFAEKPDRRRAVTAGLAAAVALSLKHTGLVVPLIGLLLILTFRTQDGGPERAPWRAGVVLVATGLLALWACTGFDTKTPPFFDPPVIAAAGPAPPVPADLGGMDQAQRTWLKEVLRLRSPWPAGLYVHSLIQGLGHGAKGHPAYLNGRISSHGWWYYQGVAASYKVPIGILILLGLGLLSFVWVPWRRAEASLLIPAVVYGAFVSLSGIAIGFRHALPAYVFLVMLAVRCVAGSPAIIRTVAWLAVVAAAVHAASFHPDYLSYFNLPREKPYLALSDSNVDWGQSLKQVRRWMDAHPAARPVTLAYFGPVDDRAMLAHYLGDRVQVHRSGDSFPGGGTLIVSPVFVAGAYEEGRGPFTPLRSERPDGVIGHSMLIYDVGRFANRALATP